jgi:hypothetical protein
MANNIRLVGDWRKLRHKFDRLSDLGQYMADQAIRELAEDVREALHEEVNSSPPPPNAPSTEKRKGHNIPLLETGGFMEEDSIIVEEMDAGDRTAYIIKGNPTKTHERSGESYETILGILNEGTPTIPSRPVIDITYDRMKNEIEALAIKKAKDYYNG